jgi:pimeloyl-ACP methyl ester carboxylesterase
VDDDVFVRLAGAGSPLVLLHGLLVSGEMFDPVVPLWSERHRLIVPDLRGHGQSAALPGPYDVAHLASDVARALDRLDVPRADVLGYSQGGTVAQQFAHDFPDRLGRLILVCTYAYNRLSRRERFEGRLASWLFATVGPAALAGAVARGSGGLPLSPVDGARLRRMLGANDRRHAVAAQRAMLAFDSRAWLADISAPTLVIRGSDDTAVPAAHATMLAAGIPGAQLRTIEGAGHFAIWTHTAEFAALVQEWLSP